MVLINLDSEYRFILKKNRRVLGVLSKSISFRTHEKNNSMHESIEVQFENKIYNIPKMAVLLRLYILNNADYHIQAGRRIVDPINEKIMKIAKSPEELHSMLSNLPEGISFRVYEYEKQIFYLKCLVLSQTPVIVMRHLYHSDLPIEVDQFDDAIKMSLLFGLSEEIISNLIEFRKIE